MKYFSLCVYFFPMQKYSYKELSVVSKGVKMTCFMVDFSFKFNHYMMCFHLVDQEWRKLQVTKTGFLSMLNQALGRQALNQNICMVMRIFTVGNVSKSTSNVDCNCSSHSVV